MLLKDTCMTVTPTVKYYVFLKSITISLFHYDSSTESSENMAPLEEKTIPA